MALATRGCWRWKLRAKRAKTACVIVRTRQDVRKVLLVHQMERERAMEGQFARQGQTEGRNEQELRENKPP